MAPATNWLSFSPIEMMSSSQSPYGTYEGSSAQPPHYFVDNFYANAYDSNSKSHVIFSEEDNQAKQAQQNLTMADSYNFTSYIDPQSYNHQTVPKLEDFFGNDSVSMVRYSDSQTETQDSTLTHIYDHPASAYFTDQQDLKALAGIQAAFSTNSGSEVEDSGSISRTTQFTNNSDFPPGGHSIESVNEMAFSQCGMGGLSLGVNQISEKAIVTVADSNSSKKVADTFGQRTSIYRGVTKHRWTGRYEAHLWDNSCRREGQARKGRQVYLGGYDKEDKAARAYDLAALKYWGSTATTNFPISTYAKEVEEMKHATKQEFIASLRRKSSGFSRGASIYRGVTRHHQQGRWQARIGRVAGNKDLYLGTFATEEEAAEAYDIAAIKFRGINAVTNFEMNRYDVEAIANSALPIGGAAKRLKLSLEAEQKPLVEHAPPKTQCNTKSSGNISFAAIQPVPMNPYGSPYDLYQQNLYHGNPSDPSLGMQMTFMPSTPAEYYMWPHQSNY